MRIEFSRSEFAGSLGDLGTLLPIAFGMVLLNGVEGTAVFFSIGLFYILSGMYFGVTVPVQPMKVIGAYAIGRSLSPLQISSAGMWIGIVLCLLAITGTMEFIRRLIPHSAIRGVQLVTGILLVIKGLGFILGDVPSGMGGLTGQNSAQLGYLGSVPVSVIVGVGAILLILLLLENRFAPAAIVVVFGGAIIGLFVGLGAGIRDFSPGFHLPRLLPFGLPTVDDITVALLVLALPQLPMTLGNAVLAQADLNKEYFGEEAAKRGTPKAFALSMGIANVVVSLIGGMPLCHGAGGLAAHYRFGARTAGSNFIIGAIFLIAGIFIGPQAINVFAILPLAVLGALLCFAGGQLSMMILDIQTRPELFVVISMLGVALVTNLAIGFGVGITLAYIFKYTKITV